MRIAVVSLTRDRLDYTKHCFETLRVNAGCDYDHFVLDQGSEDGTAEWLIRQDDLEVIPLATNVGICRGLNVLFEEAVNPEAYDVVVKFDNDCELRQPNTLRDICELTVSGGALLSPRIQGLRNPPTLIRELRIGDETILEVAQIGGIFLAAPAWVYDAYRFDEDAPLWGTDDVSLCAWWRGQGGTVGYVKRLEAWHYETTDGQHATFPEYFDRRVLEGGPA